MKTFIVFAFLAVLTIVVTINNIDVTPTQQLDSTAGASQVQTQSPSIPNPIDGRGGASTTSNSSTQVSGIQSLLYRLFNDEDDDHEWEDD